MKANRAVLAGLLAFLAAFSLAAQAGPAAILEYFESQDQVRIIDADGFEAGEVYYGMDLAAGDRVVTARTSAEIRLSPNGSIIKLSPGTDFRIETLAGVKGSEKNGFALLSGKLRTVAARGVTGRYEIRTPTAVCGVRGTDFGVSVVRGSMEAVAVREGMVTFTKNSGEAVTLGAGQAADAFAAIFQSITLTPAQMSDAFRDMDFVRLDPATVVREAPRPAETRPVETAPPPAPVEAPPVDSISKEPGLLDPVFGFLREYVGLEIGSVTIDRETYSRIIVQPTFTIGGLKAAFFLPIIYTGDLFNSNDWYRPKGNNEWSFGTDYDWKNDTVDAAGDFLRDLALKIRYIEYGEQRDPFFLRVGSINDMTLGHGSLFRKFANDTDFPAVRRVGLNLGVDAGSAGFEALAGDLAEPEIFGGRLYVRPFHPFRLGFGLSAAADIDPAGDLSDTFAATLPTDPRDVNPIILGAAADVDLPLFEGDLASMIFFVDGAGLMPYLRNEYALSALGTRGLLTDSVFYEEDGTWKVRNYGLIGGVFGNLGMLDYRLEYRQSHGLFRPGFFGQTYDRTRGLQSASLLDYLANPANPDYDKTTLGIFGEAGFSLFQHLRFEGGYLWPFEMDDGKIRAADGDLLEISIILEEGLIPISPFDRLRISLFYSRRMFVPTLLDAKAKDLDFFDANTVVKGELVYPVAPTIDLALTVTTTVVRYPDGTIRYNSDGKPKLAPSVGIEMRVHF